MNNATYNKIHEYVTDELPILSEKEREHLELFMSNIADECYDAGVEDGEDVCMTEAELDSEAAYEAGYYAGFDDGVDNAQMMEYYK